jgi:hypothetical protein
MQEEGEREGNEEGGGTGFIAKSDGLFYVWILPIFHLKLDSSVSLPLAFAFFRCLVSGSFISQSSLLVFDSHSDRGGGAAADYMEGVFIGCFVGHQGSA